MTRGNNLNGKYDEWEFARLNIVWLGTVLNGIFWIRIIWVEIFWVGIILGGNFPGGNCLGGSYPSREFSKWELSWVGIFRVGVILGGNLLWWEFSGLELSGGNHLGGNFLSGSFYVTHHSFSRKMLGTIIELYFRWNSLVRLLILAYDY